MCGFAHQRHRSSLNIHEEADDNDKQQQQQASSCVCQQEHNL